MSYVYIRSEPTVYTVGFYSPEGAWHSDSDFGSRDKAAERVHYLNGGNVPAKCRPQCEVKKTPLLRGQG